MAVGDDIKEALEDLGTSFTIIRSSGNLSGEYLDFDPNAQVTKPFVREFFLEAMVPYDTALVPGDILSMAITDGTYMLMNRTPEVVENSVAYFNSVLYKCNVSGELFRPSGEVRSTQTYRQEEVFELITADCYALLTEPLFSGDLDTDEELGLIGIKIEEMYIPKASGACVNDRYQPASGEYYRVESIRTRRYPGCDVVILGEDTR